MISQVLRFNELSSLEDTVFRILKEQEFEIPIALRASIPIFIDAEEDSV